MKTCMHLAEITNFSLNNVTVRPTKVMNRAYKNWAHFQESKYFKDLNFQKYFLLKIGLLVQYSSFEIFSPLKMCPIFVGSVHNFDKSDDDII